MRSPAIWLWATVVLRHRSWWIHVCACYLWSTSGTTITASSRRDPAASFTISDEPHRPPCRHRALRPEPSREATTPSEGGAPDEGIPGRGRRMARRVAEFRAVFLACAGARD